MKYSQSLLTLKGYSAIFMFLRQPGICQFTLLNFKLLSVIGFLDVSPVEKLLLGLYDFQKVFENHTFFPVGRAVPIGVLRQSVSSLAHLTSMLHL